MSKPKIGRRFAATALALTGATGAAVVLAGPAHAASGSTYVSYGGGCLDGNTAGQVYLHGCGPSDNPYQHWLFGNNSGGAWQLVSSATGRCLDGNAQGQVYSSPCGPADNPYQHWDVTVDGNGKVHFRNHGVWYNTPSYYAFLEGYGTTIDMTNSSGSVLTAWTQGS